jgi:hypothetical protein
VCYLSDTIGQAWVDCEYASAIFVGGVLRHLVGRGPQVARVGAFLAECRRGSSALVIEGEPGIGKTALFDAALAAAPAGLTMLRVRCVEAESTLAYTGLADLLGGRAQPLSRSSAREPCQVEARVSHSAS